MVPILIVWLIRRWRQKKTRFEYFRHLPWIAGTVFLLILLLAGANCNAQNQLNYSIIRNGDKVGTVHFSQSSVSGINYLKLESEVRTRFIFTFTATANEEAVYSNGILLRSSIYRKMNGNEKANKQHLVANHSYVVQSGKNSETIKTYPITYNMLSLYSSEPMNIQQVYSDNFETMLAIQRVGDHKYKIVLPDGNYNYYYYEKGLLNKIEIHHTLYSANVVLAN